MLVQAWCRCGRWLAAGAGLTSAIRVVGATVLVSLAVAGCETAHREEPRTETTSAPTVTPESPPLAAFGITKPSGGKTSLARAVDDAGKLTATLDLEAALGPHASMRVFVDGVEAATLAAPDFRTQLKFDRDGVRSVVVRAYDKDNAEKATAALTVEVSGGCVGQLERSGAPFRIGPPTKGVVDPVYLGPVVDGVSLRYRTSTKPDAILVACEMVGRVRRLAELVKSLGFDEIVHIGTYNYRKMRNPKCEKDDSCKLSQHAFGTALDIHAIGKVGTKTTYSTLKDWVVTPMPTCPGKPKTQGDKILHSLACQMRSKSLFSIILTPNYNATHRDHFHVDLTPNTASIKGDDYGVDPDDLEVWDE
jgi:Extensin-like protein C-terminus